MCSCRGPSACKQCSRLYKRCSCKQWPCTYTAPCVARTCWEESQTHITAALLWQHRSTRTARTLMHAANAPRRGDHAQISSTTHRSSTGRRTPSGIPGHTQHIPIRPRSEHPAAHAGSCAAPAAPHDQAHRQQPRTEHTPEPFYQPSNMEALRRSIDEMQQGKTVTKTLEELTALEDD